METITTKIQSIIIILMWAVGVGGILISARHGDIDITKKSGWIRTAKYIALLISATLLILGVSYLYNNL